MQKALDELTASLPDFAARSGIPYQTLRAYKSGFKNPSPENALMIARLMKEHSKRLEKLAKRIERDISKGRKR